MNENNHTQQPVADDAATEQQETVSKEQQSSASDETTEQPETASKEQHPSASDETTEQLETASKEQQLSASDDVDMSELKKQRQQLEQDRLKLEQDRLKLEYEKKLFERNLPKEIADYLDLSSPEKCEESYEKFMKLIPKIVDERLKGGIPLKKAPYEEKTNIDTAIKSAFDY